MPPVRRSGDKKANVNGAAKAAEAKDDAPNEEVQVEPESDELEQRAPYDESDLAELSSIAAEIDEAEKFDLTIEIVDQGDDGISDVDSVYSTMPIVNSQEAEDDDEVDRESQYSQSLDDSGDEENLSVSTRSVSIAKSLAEQFCSPSAAAGGKSSPSVASSRKRLSLNKSPGEPLGKKKLLQTANK